MMLMLSAIHILLFIICWFQFENKAEMWCIFDFWLCPDSNFGNTLCICKIVSNNNKKKFFYRILNCLKKYKCYIICTILQSYDFQTLCLTHPLNKCVCLAKWLEKLQHKVQDKSLFFFTFMLSWCGISNSNLFLCKKRFINKKSYLETIIKCY